MKLSPLQSVSFIVATTALFANSVVAAEATTDPVGFITTSVAGGGSVQNPKLSLVSPTLTRPILWQGVVASVSTNVTGPTVITVAANSWTSNQFNNVGAASGNSCYVEIVSAANPGVISDITATTTDTITTSDNVKAFVADGDSIRIRKHVTISDFLGANNSAGLKATNNASTADEVLIFDGANSVSYFYYTGNQTYPAGWYDSAFEGPAGDQVIGPHEGVIIKRKDANPISIVYSGAVKTGNTVLPIVPGKNVLGTVSAKGLTLATSGLDSTPFTKSNNASTGDEIILFTASGPTSYFYYTGNQSYAAGWYDSAFEDGPAGNVSIPAGTSFIINRKSASPFNWPLPSPTSF